MGLLGVSLALGLQLNTNPATKIVLAARISDFVPAPFARKPEWRGDDL